MIFRTENKNKAGWSVILIYERYEIKPAYILYFVSDEGGLDEGQCLCVQGVKKSAGKPYQYSENIQSIMQWFILKYQYDLSLIVSQLFFTFTWQCVILLYLF